jgi:predicted aldo/keto reductase-like oxidoreductase
MEELGTPYISLLFLHDLAVSSGDREAAHQLLDISVSSGATYFEAVARRLLGESERVREFVGRTVKELELHGLKKYARIMKEQWEMGENEDLGS